MKRIVGIVLVVVVAAAVAIAVWQRSKSGDGGGSSEGAAAADDDSAAASPAASPPMVRGPTPVARPSLPAIPTPPPQPADAGPRKITPAQALQVIQLLVKQEKIAAARDLAEKYLKEIPDGPEAQQIQALTGVHPHP